jgi:peroxiredoxin
MIKRNSNQLPNVVALFAFGLVIVNLLLIQQNHELKAYANRGTRSLALKEGTAVPSIVGEDLSGNRVLEAYTEDSRQTLLLVFSPSCHVCSENMPNWEKLSRQLDLSRFRLVAMSLKQEGTKEYVANYDLRNGLILSMVDAKTRAAYELALTPQTILIDATGKVEKVWTGVLDGATKKDVEGVLNVNWD